MTFSWKAGAAASLGMFACALAVAAAGPAGAQARRDSITLYEYPDYTGASVTFYADHAAVGSTGFADKAQSAQVIGDWRVCAGGGFRNRCEVLSGNVRNLAAYGLSRQVGSVQRLSGASAPDPIYQPAPYADRSPSPYIGRAPAPEARPLPPAEPYDSYRPYDPAPATPPARDYGRGYDPTYSDARPGYGFEPSPVYGAPARDAGPAAYDPYAGATTGASGETAVFFARPMLRGMAVSASGVRAADDFCRTQGLSLALYFDANGRADRSTDANGRMTGAGPVLQDVLCRRF